MEGWRITGSAVTAMDVALARKTYIKGRGSRERGDAAIGPGGTPADSHFLLLAYIKPSKMRKLKELK